MDSPLSLENTVTEEKYSRNQNRLRIHLKSWGWELNPYRAALQYQPLNFEATKQGYIKYIEFKRYNKRTARSMVSYLNRFVTEIKNAIDVMNMFSPLTDGQRHNLNRAM